MSIIVNLTDETSSFYTERGKLPSHHKKQAIEEIEAKISLQKKFLNSDWLYYSHFQFMID